MLLHHYLAMLLLVVVMHGCTQTASQYATESGWNVLADQHQFYTVYPEQNSPTIAVSVSIGLITAIKTEHRAKHCLLNK